VSYFKNERDPKAPKTSDVRLDAGISPGKPQDVSTLGAGMLITGNIVSTGAVEIHGRVVGDIHVSQLNICEGAQVEGKIVAQEAVIDGSFKGTIHGNNVKLRGTSMVDGEIFNKSLTIEQSAQFEGVARRLDKAVEAPSSAQSRGMQSADVVPISDAVAYPDRA
jgi:cytoskeletal protein CcmA (bactofilin family)